MTRRERIQPGNVDSQALMGEFVDDRQAFDLLPVGTGIEDEVVGPDVIGGLVVAAGRVVRRRCAGAVVSEAAAAQPCATSVQRARRSWPSPRGAGRSEFGDSRSGDTAMKAVSWSQSRERPSLVAAARRTRLSEPCRSARRRVASGCPDHRRRRIVPRRPCGPTIFFD